MYLLSKVDSDGTLSVSAINENDSSINEFVFSMNEFQRPIDELRLLMNELTLSINESQFLEAASVEQILVCLPSHGWNFWLYASSRLEHSDLKQKTDCERYVKTVAKPVHREYIISVESK